VNRSAPSCPNPDRILKADSLVTAVIETAKPEQGAGGSAASAADRSRRPYALVVDAENKVQVRRFKSGSRHRRAGAGEGGTPPKVSG